MKDLITGAEYAPQADSFRITIDHGFWKDTHEISGNFARKHLADFIRNFSGPSFTIYSFN